MSIKKDNEMMAHLYTEGVGGESIPQENASAVTPGVRVRKETYEWGTLVVIEKGHDFSIPLHPEHQDVIGALQDGESTSITDETRTTWNVTRKGDVYMFSNIRGGNKVDVGMDEFPKEMVSNRFRAIGYGEGDVSEDAEEMLSSGK